MLKTLGIASLMACCLPLVALAQELGPIRYAYPDGDQDLVLYSYLQAAEFPPHSVEMVEIDIIVKEALATCKNKGAGFLARPVHVTVDTGRQDRPLKQYLLTYCP